MKTLTVPANVLFELEQELNKPLFMGVPIGSTLNNVFHIEFFNGLGSWDFKSVWMDRLRLLYHYLRGSRLFAYSTEFEMDEIQRDRILVTLLHDRSHIHDLMVPVINRLGPATCNILLGNTKLTSALPSDTGVLPIGILSSFFDIEMWRKEFRLCFPRWRRSLKLVLDKHKIPRYVIPHLSDAIMISSQHIIAYHHLLDLLAPSAVVTEFDRNYMASSLILAAKLRGIPTMTMLHGVINPPYGYVPLLADFAFCWGQLSYDQMVEMGTNPERLCIVGYQRLTPTLSVDQKGVRSRLGISNSKPLVMLVTNPISFSHRKQIARSFCQAFTGQDQIVAIIRLHPSEKLATYQTEITDFPKIRFMEANFMSSEEAMAIADVIICRNSGFGNDALVKGKIVVVLNNIDAPLGNAASLIKAGCPHVQSAEALRTLVKRILAEPELCQELHQKTQRFVNYQFAAFGDKAVDNIVAFIHKER